MQKHVEKRGTKAILTVVAYHFATDATNTLGGVAVSGVPEASKPALKTRGARLLDEVRLPASKKTSFGSSHACRHSACARKRGYMRVCVLLQLATKMKIFRKLSVKPTVKWETAPIYALYCKE
jgi:hypothetical protein